MAFGVKATPIYVNPLGENSTSAALSLQGVIDARGNTLVNVNSDQLNSGTAAAWTSTGGSFAAMVVEVAGSATVNAFGIYDLADPSQKIQIFAGIDTGGATTTFTSPWSTFGFYLLNPALGEVWYSDSSLNGGEDHVVAYQGKGQTLNLGNDPNNPDGSLVWDSNSYLFGWEDRDLPPAPFGDADYNDMVVVISNIQPIPDDFTTVGLLGMTMIGLIFLQKKYFIQRKQPVKALATFKRTFYNAK